MLPALKCPCWMQGKRRKRISLALHLPPIEALAPRRADRYGFNAPTRGAAPISVYRAAGAGFVAQIFNLLYRRLAVGRVPDRSHVSAAPNRWQSATLRYSIDEIIFNDRSAGTG